MLERLKTSDAIAGLPCKSGIQISNFKVNSEIENQISNSNFKLSFENQISIQDEINDLRDLAERYWRIIQAQHVKIAQLESELCARNARR